MTDQLTPAHVPPLTLPASIRTERLILRIWEDAHARQLTGALAESVQHLLPWIPWASAEVRSFEEVQALVSSWVVQRRSGASLIYAVFQAADERLIGGIGVHARVAPDRLEIGYWMRRTETGRGFATEAAHALTVAAYHLSHNTALEIHTHPSNVLSRRIPDMLAYRLLGI